MISKSVSPKPPCNIVRSYGLKDGIFGINILDRHLIRDNFCISTWLLLGATLQTTLLLLPIRPSYALAPAVILLAYRAINTVLMCFGFVHNPYMNGVTPGKATAIFPISDNSSSNEKNPSNADICMILLPARSNHPLGLFAPGFKDLADSFKEMIFDLDANAPSNGFLGGSSFSNTSDRDCSSEIMNIMYFQSHEHLQKFAHSPAHRKGWDWWNRSAKKYGHIGISHEVYSVPAGKWENIYVNYHAAGFSATAHLITDEKGDKQWASPLIDAARGKFRTAPGRMGVSQIGNDNEKYGEEPYDNL